MTKGAATEVSLDRRLGAFYTPDDLATVLASWAINRGDTRVLDPSFGGCSFLRAAHSQLRRLGVRSAGTKIYGVDVDPRALRYAQELFDRGVPEENIVLRDFFDVTPTDVGGSFDAVLGNPPYVRHHWFTGASRDTALKSTRAAGVDLDGRASAWAYFLVHSVNFLKLGGKLAQLLPGAVLQADYAPTVLSFLQSRFRSVRLIRLLQRQFPDVQEETVVLLASGCGRRSSSDVCVTHAADVDALARQMSSGAPGGSPVGGPWRLATLTPEQQDAWLVYQTAPQVANLASLCTVKIGTVTGANDFFLRTARETTALGIRRRDTRSALPNQKHLRGLEWTVADLRAAARTGNRTRLLVLRERPGDGPTEKLIHEGQRDRIHLRTKCKARHPWHLLNDVDPPDCFFPYMSARVPRIVVNTAASSCLNSIHRLFWTRPEVSPLAVAVASLTSAFALAAEIHGRTYGGGVLKLEPSDVLRLPVATVTIPHRVRIAIDRAMRTQDWTTARDLADDAVLVNAMGMRGRDVKALRNAARFLAQRR